MKTALYKLFLSIFILIFYSTYSKSQSVEYYIKVSFIEKFARFTEWDNNSIGDNFIIGIIGENPMQKELDKLSETTKIKGKPIKVVQFQNIKNITDCNILYISSSEKKQLSQIVAVTKNKQIMLIGDTPGYAENGVHFNFYIKPDQKLHFEINVKSLIQSGLKTDIQLINIGKVIK